MDPSDLIRPSLVDLGESPYAQTTLRCNSPSLLWRSVFYVGSVVAKRRCNAPAAFSRAVVYVNPKQPT
ncbi:hypothetical protein SAMN05444157_0736 [Frankineae bacterium MT45]|nr:hypothetical protein SAMN05444157_0736 [Frankineae bacterium MT45]